MVKPLQKNQSEDESTDTLTGKPSDKGFVLIAVLWGLGLLTLLLSTFILTAHNQRKTSVNMIENARAESFADAGIHLAVLDLLKASQNNRRFQLNGIPYTCQIHEDAVLTISIQDEEGKIDLNTAPDALLTALITSLGTDDQSTARYVDAIADFRDADNVRRLNGAESDDYKAAQLPQRPKDNPFQTKEELDQVLGLPPALIRLLRPFITVHSKRGGLDPALAPQDLLRLLKTGPASINNSNTSNSGAPDGAAGGFPPAFAITSGQRTFTLTIRSQTTRNGHFIRRALVELQPGRLKPYRFKSWERGNTGDAPEPDASPSALGRKC